MLTKQLPPTQTMVQGNVSMQSWALPSAVPYQGHAMHGKQITLGSGKKAFKYKSAKFSTYLITSTKVLHFGIHTEA